MTVTARGLLLRYRTRSSTSCASPGRQRTCVPGSSVFAAPGPMSRSPSRSAGRAPPMRFGANWSQPLQRSHRRVLPEWENDVMRSIWKGALSFGLVTIPVKLYGATQTNDVSFHQVHDDDGGRIRYRRVCEL